jgi:Ca2+-binding EF-hand superfamily protein
LDVIGGDDSFEIDRKAWDRVLREVDIDGDGRINFDEFVKILNE